MSHSNCNTGWSKKTNIQSCNRSVRWYTQAIINALAVHCISCG